VVHVDGTARIQSVQPQTNTLYSRQIGESVPALINTSLNINEQPMVNSPPGGSAHLFLFPSGCAFSWVVPAVKIELKCVGPKSSLELIIRSDLRAEHAVIHARAA
jgi:hypothetical protein